MTYYAVLPSVYQPWTDRCLKTCDIAVDVIDNTDGKNIGVSASWNIGAQIVVEDKLDWLIIMSAALRFGDARGIDFLDILSTRHDRIAVEAAHGIGWHLIAFHRSVFETVGYFDENFLAYHEDLDMGHRIHLGFDLDPPYWEKVSVDVAIAGFAHGIDLGGIKVDEKGQREYFKRKWNVYPGENMKDAWTHPFGDKPLDYCFYE